MDRPRADFNQRDLKPGDRVLDINFPEWGPATISQHPNPHTVRDGRDKWLVTFDDKTKPVIWIGKKGAFVQVKLIEA